MLLSKNSYLLHSFISAENNPFSSEKWDSVLLKTQSKDTAASGFAVKLGIPAPDWIKP